MTGQRRQKGVTFPDMGTLICAQRVLTFRDRLA